MFLSSGGSILGSIIIPSTITSIGINAFLGQESLKQVNFIDGLQIIGEGMIAMTGYPSALTAIIIPSSVTSVGENNLHIQIYI